MTQATVKTCSGCKQCSPEVSFSTKARYCRGCVRKNNKQHYVKNLEKSRKYHREYRKAHYDAEKQRACQLKHKYGLTIEQRQAMVDQQEGKCFICRTEKRVLFIDHDHATGKIRSLLCHNCNAAIGLFDEDPAVLRRAATYIEHHAGEEN